MADKTITVEMTLLEANAVLRVLAAGNASTGEGSVHDSGQGDASFIRKDHIRRDGSHRNPASQDQLAASWVAKRILAQLNPETVNP